MTELRRVGSSPRGARDVGDRGTAQVAGPVAGGGRGSAGPVCQDNFFRGLQDLLRSDAPLPTLPVAVFHLHQALECTDTSEASVVAIIERDPALASRTLAAANAVRLSHGGTAAGSISEAVQSLGVDQVRSVCIALGVVRAFEGHDGGLDYERFWAHSIAVGMVAERLAQELSPAAMLGVDVYVAGLLHDVGHLVLAHHFPGFFREIVREVAAGPEPVWQVEEARLGLDHGEIGGLLLGRWAFPRPIVDAVTFHHHPSMGPPVHLPVVQVIWAAEALCSAAGLDLPHEGLALVRPGEVLEMLNIPANEERSLLEEIGQLEETAREVMNAPDGVGAGAGVSGTLRCRIA